MNRREKRKLETRERIRAAANATSALVARHILFVYSASLRWWIAGPRLRPEKGVADLRRLLQLQFRELSPAGD
jgi:hypothetical protein